MCVELEVPVILFPGFLGGSVEVFFVREFLVAMIIVVASAVGMVHSLGSLPEGFIFDGELDMMYVLEDASSAAHEPIE